jgi:uncharacterized protein YwgA
LKSTGNFKNSSFEGRLIFQKTVYFLQVFKINLGYNFKWYIYGPYCKELADEGYKLGSVGSLNKIHFVTTDVELMFNKFLKFLGDKKNDVRWIELMASIDFLRRAYPQKTKLDILKNIKSKQTYFTDKEFEDGWTYLQSFEETR